MNAFVTYLTRYYHIKKDVQQELEKHIICSEIAKDEFLLREGNVCRRLYFVEEGVVRAFHYKDGREVTGWFGFDSDLVTSFHSFIDQQPGREFIQALENCTLWSIGRDQLYDIYNQYPEVERLGRITCEQYYIRLEDRFVNAHFKTATERYHNLISQYPHIIQRVPLGFIASYLGISQETLSRIRAKTN
ncbi:MAG: Crp/Fnr family transcriptional regulator [Cyclobacteriaceae bacterium]